MGTNSVKVSDLPTTSNVTPTDRIMILKDPTGAPSVRTVNVGVLAANLTIRNYTPATSDANGVAGTIAYDNEYIYVCVSNNAWMRASISTWI